MISYQAEYFLCAAHIYDVYTRYKNQIAAAIVLLSPRARVHVSVLVPTAPHTHV